MANRRNDWQGLLKLANKELEKHNAEIGVYEEDGQYSITIVTDGNEEEYAGGYYEDELSAVINEAWSHALSKVK